jgi:transketolase
VALIDCNGIQADGPIVLDMEPVVDKWAAFGWATQQVDGNDIGAVIAALHAARAHDGKPKAIVLRTLPGKGVPEIETSEKSHFFRVDVSRWDGLIATFERSVGERA